MVNEKPLPEQLHDLAHELIDEVDAANDHLEQAHNALLSFIDQIGDQQPDWVDILLQKAGKLQAASDILVVTTDEIHNPETWALAAFGDEPTIGRA
jgi:ABC-type transporter Mla subunit MlaD